MIVSLEHEPRPLVAHQRDLTLLALSGELARGFRVRLTRTPLGYRVLVGPAKTVVTLSPAFLYQWESAGMLFHLSVDRRNWEAVRRKFRKWGIR